MKRIYYGELVSFINLENINLKSNVVRKGQTELDYSKYDSNHGVIQGHLSALKDISTLGESVLQYPMGAGIQMSLFNLIMQAKGLLVDKISDKEIELGINTSVGNTFEVWLIIEEGSNLYSKMKISNNRRFELTGLPGTHTLDVAEKIRNKFNALAGLYI